MRDPKIVRMLREAEKMTLEGVMEMLKLDKETAIGLLESGKIKSKKSNGNYVIYESDVLQYMADDIVSMFKKELDRIFSDLTH